MDDQGDSPIKPIRNTQQLFQDNRQGRTDDISLLIRT